MNGWVEYTVTAAFLSHIYRMASPPQNQKKASMATDETDYEKGALWSKVAAKSSLNSQ